MPDRSVGRDEGEGEPTWIIWKAESLPPVFSRRERIDLAVHGPNVEVCVGS